MALNSTRDPLSTPLGHPMGGGMVSSLSGGAGAIKETALSRLEAATKMVEAASRGVLDVADRLCGSQPEETSCRDKCPQNGVFDEIEALAIRLNEYAKSIMDDVGRIQRRL